MKNKLMKCASATLVMILFFQLGFAQHKHKMHNKYEAVATKIVDYNLNVQPGEVVQISGTSAEIDLMEELVVAVAKAGGQSHVNLNIPTANKRAFMAMPIDYLKIPRTYPVLEVRNVDCFINVGSVQNPGLFADVPEERMAAFRQGGTAVAGAARLAHYRSVDLGQVGGLPTQAYTESIDADFHEMNNMFWKAVDADYDQIAQMGGHFKDMMKAGESVSVTSALGTDLTFSVGKTKPEMNSGSTEDVVKTSGPASVWLPAGEVYVALDPTSANGTLVVPSMRFRNKNITNLRLTFENGRMTSFSGDEGADFIKESIKMSTGDSDVLSLIDIGLNPNSHQLAGSKYCSYEMAGMVTVSMGNNSWAGGTVEADNAFTFFLPKTTVKIGNHTVVNNGELNDNMAMKK